ncbi:hypothetical protein QBC46DRAFT_355443 [Diplogelasinospora grovesii]|uniref:Anaphase-promoting complex subunit 1 N-terminal domain-containing protein n=1 Tax=Diplogelasinospora grovesii TaxID=303347 RepID=A0AAN6S2S2_9PEZI|nr:hypothetical protein QBC46DRAFT_355443 [Diplogelasinospora grovesii]
MASVLSLGEHHPAGLQHAIDEGILPTDPPPSSYSWEVFTDTRNEHECQDELLTTNNCVLWSRGGIFRKSYTFDLENESVTQALLTYFPASADTGGIIKHDGSTAKDSSERAGFSRAIVVFLKTQAHIYFLSGTSHIVHMPFEVESACAAPCGVIIQRKLKMDNVAPASLRLPKVPPNTFVSNQTSPFSVRNSKVFEFSTAGLGNPKTLPLRLSSTLENMWQPLMETSDSRWPRLVCLTDPLNELGLVVTQPDTSKTPARRRSSVGSLFLNPAEEIVHVQAIKLPDDGEAGGGELSIAVTINRETNMYSVWQLTYLETEDPFIGRKKQQKAKPSRRRSSMAPGLASGGATPLHPTTRESFGVPLPGKKPRKSERVEKLEKLEKLEKAEKAAKKDRAYDTALSSLDPEKGNNATRRQSRRVSSLLARADLSTSQDRTTFIEQPHAPSHAAKRVESQCTQRSRLSGGYGGRSVSGAFHKSLNSLSEAPIDHLLHEMRAAGDGFDGVQQMDLDDHEFDGLAHEMLFTKIHSIPMDNANMRYSLSSLPARTQSKIYIVVGPPCIADEPGRTELLVGIQDPMDRKLQLLTLYAERQEAGFRRKASKTPGPGLAAFTVSVGDLTRAQGIIDSCKVSDGTESILVLSEDGSGGRTLSLQSPWGPQTVVSLPLLFSDDLKPSEYGESHTTPDRLARRRRRSTRISQTQIEALCHAERRGVVDLQDRNGTFHRVRIKLQPSCPQVRKMLDACRSVLPATHAESMLAGWWHTMQWLEQTKQEIYPHSTHDEWSSVAILLLASVLALDCRDEARLQDSMDFSSPPAAKSSWETMLMLETPNSSSCPSWTRNRGWQWLLDEGTLQPAKRAIDTTTRSRSFMSVHIGLAKKYMASPLGAAAFGHDGYLPTAVGMEQTKRETAAWAMMLALHLLLEEQKLGILSPEDSSPGQSDLRGLLCQLAKWLGWHNYEAVYELGMQAELETTEDSAPLANVGLNEPPTNYCVLSWVQDHLTTNQDSDFPTLSDVHSTAYSQAVADGSRTRLWKALTPLTLMFKKLFELSKLASNPIEIVEAMHECGFTTQVLEKLPEAVLTPFQDIILLCQPDPPLLWSKDHLRLVNRTDMFSVLEQGQLWRGPGADVQPQSHAARWDVCMVCQQANDLQDQLEEPERQAVVRSLFKDDRRLNEAQSLLSCTKPRVLRLDAKPEWAEAEYLERQQELATTVATSTLAIPAGRGLLYYALKYPLLTQKYSIGGFNLQCIVKPANNTVGVDKSLFSEEKINWAFFHQGVAGGLAISPHATGIDTKWILYNKPAQDLSNRHAGFLLALGLNGHLKSIAKWVAFKYLTPKHTMTSIGLLLGLAASYLGTMDSLITRLLSVHVTRMLPRGAAELNLSKHMQTTGIMGIGLLYCHSQHRRMSEIMMSEIEHVDDEDEEDPLRDEGYRLAAGFALGFINLGKGSDLKGLRDMRLTEKLITIATSTKQVELVHVLDRSAAAAVVAIALIFMKSEDEIVARKVDIPDTVVQFDYVRPDILLLRTVAKNLVLWSKMKPTLEWIKNSLPPEYRSQSHLSDVAKLQSRHLAFFSILAGLCSALGLRFAGSANIQVRDLLIHYLDEFMRIVRTPTGNFDTETARTNARMCMDTVALACATVMAGTGDLVVLRRLRALHGRDDANTTYGSHLAAHLAIGALFLGCGTATFGTSNLAIAALLVAFYPLFPASVQDNRSHLQAFRHFWVLAADPRCLVTKDFGTGQPLSVPVLIQLKAGSPSAAAAVANNNYASNDGNAVTIRRQTPCLLPPLEDVKRLRTDAGAQGFWDLTIDFERSPQLVDDFHKNQSLYLRRRPAHESPFPATLRALGSGDIAGTGTDSTDREPVAWLFGLKALRDLTHAERALVLDLLGSGGGGAGEGEGTSTAVDTRLALRRGLDGWSRDRLLGLRLLFEWADKRSQLVAAPQTEVVNDASATANQSKQQDMGKGKGKGKATAGKKGSKKKVSLATSSGQTTIVPDGETEQVVAAAAPERENIWWLRDGAIEELKGMAWLAGREE